MAVNVLTFSVQLGSGGEAVARAVASQLGMRYYDRQIINEAASRAGVSPEAIQHAEHWAGFMERMLETLGQTSLLTDAGGGAPVITPQVLTLTSADYRGLIENVVNELADRGNCVIVGHAGQAILANRPAGVFKVLIHGDAGHRARRLAAESSVSEKEATEEIEEADSQRLEFFKHVYHIEWLDAANYDLTINTDEVDADGATTLVLAAIA